MLLLYRKNQELYVKVNLDLKRRLKMKPENKMFEVGDHVELLLPDDVMYLLTVNGNIRLWNGQKFIKLNLGQFYDVMKNKDYKIEDYVEPVKHKEVVEEKPIVQPKVEEKVEEEPVIEEPVQQVQPEVKQEQPKKDQNNNNNNNKKQRHNNNNKNNQGGDK